ncbi:hypothetical protein A3715_07450 [Oleiphilus sp. HI0009]|nr:MULTISPECIES: glycerol-3-phosphate dehydrogenase/oxidase [unclassified Oleiphilus]KZX81359.1 hypothetical protein A3715_07450 [Oleiphilus sp. HI0009]KZY63272.1 hypothetical protein A3738_12120 [Oleiphilus sp. HI0066]KZY70815.1 hypothetical protein A3739_06075 [Oleiphilus sp. HI0067]MCH2159665.1 glycerol-3-phosphate dehydrogenase/oxidase [Oleiphilaceae bacterium]
MALSYWSPGWRDQTLQSLSNGQSFDLIVVGGGITGAGIYREATAKGLKVLLVEQKDFAWGTSSRSSKMVHGGLRYLGKGQFGLAKDSVTERQKLMEQLKGLVDPLPFLMGHYKGGFPGPWIFDKLLAIYDLFAGKRYRQFVKSQVNDFYAPGMKQRELLGATRFMDAVTDDARLVMRVLADGNEQGGIALNYLKATGVMRSGSEVERNTKVIGLYLKDELSGKELQVQANAVVNASGAWTDELRQMLGNKKSIRPLRGSHLVIPFWRLPVAFSVSFFHPKDKRPVFVFPWEGQVVIGTTDLDHHNTMLSEASITENEVTYLLDAANSQFDHAALKREDIISSWSGVRPVVVDEYSAEDVAATNKPSDEKREHMVWDDAGCISIAGGKLTTFRLLALEVLRAAQPYLQNNLSISDLDAPSDFSESDESVLIGDHKLSKQRRQRLVGRYGDIANQLVEQADIDDLTLLGNTEVCLQELFWACENEAVEHLDDLLLRRVRIGMLYPEGAIHLIQPWTELLRERLQWPIQKWDEEWHRYKNIIADHYSLPNQKECV